MTAEKLDSPERLARTWGRQETLAALITAGGVWTVLVGQAILLTLLGAVKSAGLLLQSDYTFSGAGPLAGGYAIELVNGSFTIALPFAAGVFLSLWRLLPITAELPFAHVLTRAIVAGVIGGLAAVAVGVIVGVAQGLSGVPLLGDVAGAITRAGAEIWISVLSAAVSALSALVLDLPLVVLAGLLLWGWLQRRPSTHPVPGAPEEI